MCAALLCWFFFNLKIGSAVWQIQDILLEYEGIIERERNLYVTVCREVKKLESEKESSQLTAKEALAQLEMERKNDIQSLKYVTLHSDKVLSCQCLYSRRCWWYRQ